MKIFLTGVAGFIGSYVARALLDRGDEVLGVDNLNDYYDPRLKQARLALIEGSPNFRFHQCDIADAERLKQLASDFRPDAIVHLAAQAGVRYSIDHPQAYAHSNLLGHLAVLEMARAVRPRVTVYASSSSVYGANEKIPFAEDDRTDSQVSLYGATKKSGEAMAVSYTQLYDLNLTGLRFFTVYGPWGRPDMAYWIFTEKMLRGEAIDVFNSGQMSRDFTYIDDIVAGVLGSIDHGAAEAKPRHRIYNLGNDQPQPLLGLIEELERALGIEAKKNFLSMQSGDVKRTWANIDRARKELAYSPATPLREGIERFISWRKSDAFTSVGLSVT